MTSLNDVKRCLAEQKSLLKNKYYISKIGIFGSCVRGNFDKGSGDYVADRQEWQQGYSVDILMEAIKNQVLNRGKND